MNTPLGVTSIVIRADMSSLPGEFASAEAAARTAGSRIGAALTEAFAPGAARATGLVDQFGRALGTTLPNDAEKAARALRLATQAAREVATAGAALADSLVKVSGATQEASQHVQSFTGLIPGMGYAAERFINMVPGLGAAIMTAFPLLGAIAFAQGLVRIGENIKDVANETIGLKQAMDGLKTATHEADSAIVSLGKTIDTTNIDRQTQEFGRSSGLKLKANLLAMDAQADFTKAKELYSSIRRLEKENELDNAVNPGVLIPGFAGDIYAAQKAELDTLRQQAAGAEASGTAKSIQAIKDRDDAQRNSVEEAVALGRVRIKNEQTANRDQSDLARQRVEIWVSAERDLKQKVIGEQLDSHQRAVETAAVNLELAKETAAKIGAIDYAESQRRIQLIEAEAKVSSTGKAPAEIARINAEARGQIANVRAEQERQELALHSDVLQAVGQLDNAQIAQQRAITEAIIKDGEKRLAVINKLIDPIIDKSLTDATKLGAIKARSTGEQEEHSSAMKRLELERSYALAVDHSSAASIQQARQLDAVDREREDAHIRTLQAQREQAQIGLDIVKVSQLDLEILQAKDKAAERRYQTESRIQQQQRDSSLRGQLEGAAGGKTSVIDRATVAAASLVRHGVDGISSSLGHAIVQGGKLGQVFKGIGKELAGEAFSSVLKIGLQQILRSLLGLVPAFAAVGSAQVAAAATAHAAMSTLNVGTVISEAAVGAAAAWASTSAIPIVGPILAPAVAAETFTSIISFAPLAAFAEGGRPPVGIASIVGERGPELFVPDGAGEIIPAGQFGAATAGGQQSSSTVSSSIGSMVFNVHGQQNPDRLVRDVMRKLPQALKNQNPGFSPFSTRSGAR